VPVNHTILLLSVLYLATGSVAHAEDRMSSFPDLGFKQQHLYSADTDLSAHEYEEVYSRNRSIVRNNLQSYSRNIHEFTGMPEQGINLMGAVLGFAVNGTKLNLNKSKTLALELKDTVRSKRAIYFGLKLEW